MSKPWLRRDGTIDPAAYDIDAHGCHVWRGATSGKGEPQARWRRKPVSVRHWLLGNPPAQATKSTCGNGLCVNRAHLTLALDAAKARGAKGGSMMRYRRIDVARLLVEVPAGVIAEQDRTDLAAYASGERFRDIGARTGERFGETKARLREAEDRLLSSIPPPTSHRETTRRYARNHVCIVCGAPSARPDTRCATCSKSHRKARMRGYLADYHDRTRPAPEPIAQPDPALPPYGQIVTDDERIQCHVCGKWFGGLGFHVRAHGLDADRYREHYGLARTASLLGPAAAEKQRQAALARDQGAVGRAQLAEIGPGKRPKGLEMRRQSRIAESVAHRKEPDDQSPVR